MVILHAKASTTRLGGLDAFHVSADTRGEWLDTEY
jgi:hypothetical protein